MKKAIVIENLTKTYGALKAVDNISFYVEYVHITVPLPILPSLSTLSCLICTHVPASNRGIQ